MITELFNPTKLMSFLKNKFCTFIIQKLLTKMSNQEKMDIKEFIVTKITVTSNKEKNKLNSFLEYLDTSVNLPNV